MRSVGAIARGAQRSIVPEWPLKNQFEREALSTFVGWVRGRETTIVSENASSCVFSNGKRSPVERGEETSPERVDSLASHTGGKNRILR